MPKNTTAKKRNSAIEPEVVGKDEQLELVRSLESGITRFFMDAGKFFKEASLARTEAKDVLKRANALTVPRNDEADKIVQRVVIDSNNGRKLNSGHWEPITKTFNRVHKALTAGRGEAEKDFIQAASIGNRLHSGWVDEKERKAKIEQDRVDRLARAAAQLQRDQINRRLEEERLKIEENSPTLSVREQSFVTAYDRHGDIIRAEKAADYQSSYGLKLIERPKIKAALEVLVKRRELAKEQEAARSAPIITKSSAPVRANISHVVGGGTRRQSSAKVYDEAALIEAILMQASNPPAEGEPVIPTNILSIKHPRVNEYARSLGSAINEWPGVRFTQERKVTGS